jgi:DNA-binding transcriptional MerR regulator
MAVEPGEAQWSIGGFCELTGLNPVTLRAWERRHGLLEPHRSPGGHRLYGPGDVERVRRIRELLERGARIGQVPGLLSNDAPQKRGSRQRDTWGELVRRMSASVTRFDEAELDRLYDQVFALQPVDRILRQLLMPVMRELGRRWERSGGGVAEEHFFATYLRSKLGARLQHRVRLGIRHQVVGACAPGEPHELGLLAFALEADAAGIHVLLLGANTPIAGMTAACRAAQAEAIVVSCSLAPAPGFLEEELPALVREAGVPVLVGGGVALRERAAIERGGAVAAGVDVATGVQLLARLLGAGA